MKLKCAIIDDDPIFIDILKHYIEKSDMYETAGIYLSAVEAMNNLESGDIDFLFLDVEMPEFTGLDYLGTFTTPPPVVVVSQKKAYAADAFDFDSIDFLHKPVSYARFLKACKKINSYFEEETKVEKKIPRGVKNALYVKDQGVYIKIQTESILHAKADNDHVILTTETGRRHRYSISLKDLVEQLPSDQFMRIHRSYVVQVDKIDKVDGEVIEVNHKTLPVSKTYIKQLYERLAIK